ncbi:MAG: hypothetical protein ACM3U2_23135 [Deltaproteobacteria bacterium]
MTDRPEKTIRPEAEPEDVAAEHGDPGEAEISVDEQAELAHREQLTAKMRGGANWFFWIAGLSIANTVILLMEGDRHFVVGLGITQLVNGVALAFAQQAPETAMIGKVVAFVITLLASAVVAAFGFGARRGMAWLFTLGMALYFLDGLLFLLFQDWMSVGFHLFALYCMFGGLRAARELNGLDRIVLAEAD